jgi:hypothetical protein
MPGKTAAQVHVSNTGPNGRPVASVLVHGAISAAELGSLIAKVPTHDGILKAVGLGPCGTCKSGLDINILDMGRVFEVHV